MINLTQPIGWNKWALARTTVSEVQLPDASFPVSYTPASSFWVQSAIGHCLVPWFQVMDPFELYLRSGGRSGTIGGSLGGLAAWEQLYDIWVAGASFSLFGTAPGPRFGYNIGTSFKQLVYVRFDIQNVPLKVLDLGHTIELLENSRFKRIYVNHGEIKGYYVVDRPDGTREHILDIGINKMGITEEQKGEVGDTNITIISPDGTSFIVRAKSMTNNWGVVIEDPEDKIPSAGDFYQLDTTWVIEDPYLLSGFFVGREWDSNASAQSGLNLYVSDKEKPYEEGKILGIYIWRQKDVDLPMIYQPHEGVNMRDKIAMRGFPFEWVFWGFDNSDASQTYNDDIRYKENVLNEVDEEGNVNKYTIRNEADVGDYTKLLENPTTNHLRVEISGGGYYTRNNWYAPSLAGSYLNIDDKLYKILAHVEANIIDVSIKSVDGKSELPRLLDDPDTDILYSIINQSAWMINENYFQSFPSLDTVGIFEGNITEIEEDDSKKITVIVAEDPKVARSEKNGFSLVERYKTEIEIPDTMVKLYRKQQDWKLVSHLAEYSNLGEYLIESIEFFDPENEDGSRSEDGYGSYKMKIILREEQDSLSVGQLVYVSFDDLFKTTSDRLTSKMSSSLSLDITAAAEGKMPMFMTSNVLCLDGVYSSAPYAINIPIDSRVGVCDGYLFGLDANGSAAARYGDLMFFTVLVRIARGIASLFHPIRQEDWVAYQDIITKKITIRCGSLNFKEYPMKNMVVIGDGIVENARVEDSEIQLNTGAEWLRRIQLTLPAAESTDSLGVLFGIGNKDNIYGSYVSGDGLIDLELLRKQGITRGEFSSNIYQWNGYNVSPVYVYKRNYYQNLERDTIDIGVKTIDGPIYVNSSQSDGYIGYEQLTSLSDVTAEYIRDNQTIEAVGGFDIIYLPHGEVILVYGRKMGEFMTVVGGDPPTTLNNSVDHLPYDNTWAIGSCIMIVGTSNDSFVWNAPLTRTVSLPNIDPAIKRRFTRSFQYAMMVLNSVEYLSSTYNPLNNNLYIFVGCTYRVPDEDPPLVLKFLGCLTVNMCQLSPFCAFERNGRLEAQLKDNVFFSLSKDGYPFFWRHPLLKDELIRSDSYSWTDPSKCLIDDRYSYDREQNTDNFIRIMGPGQTNSQIEYYGFDLEAFSSHLLPDGTLMAFFGAGNNVEAIFSNDSGRTWRKSSLIYVSNGRFATLIGHCLFYISEYGIEMKKTDFTDFYGGLNERNTQELLDNKRTIIIGSGPIRFQRLSGYITPDGTMKIFFYDNSNLLKCMESKDSSVWTVADNF